MGLHSKRFDEPDELQELPLQTRQVVTLGEVFVSRTVLEPGWSWAEHVKPIVGTPSCQHHHQGVILSGRIEFETDEGARRVFGPGEAFDAPPGHDARVVGEEQVVSIEFAGARGFGKPAEAGERVVATLLVTDIVDSTAVAARLGDAAWKELLGRHGDRVRLELDRFRGFEVTTTGDGFLAVFDGAARAVRCAAAIRRAAELDDLQIRAGVPRARSSARPGTSAAWQCTPRPVLPLWPSRGKCSCPRPPRACSRARGSHSRTRGSTSSRAFQAAVASIG